MKKYGNLVILPGMENSLRAPDPEPTSRTAKIAIGVSTAGAIAGQSVIMASPANAGEDTRPQSHVVEAMVAYEASDADHSQDTSSELALDTVRSSSGFSPGAFRLVVDESILSSPLPDEHAHVQLVNNIEPLLPTSLGPSLRPGEEYPTTTVHSATTAPVTEEDVLRIIGSSSTTETPGNEIRVITNTETLPQHEQATATSVSVLNQAIGNTIDYRAIESGQAIDITPILESARQLDQELADADEHRPADLPPGVIKLFTHDEAPGLQAAFTVAERTAPVERYGSEVMVAGFYALSELYQQMVEDKYPEYTGSMLRARDFLSPHHRTHNTEDNDLSSAMGPQVTWYSDGPVMDQYSPNYDREFTEDFLRAAAQLEINGRRVYKQMVYEDREMILELDADVDPNYGGYALWHKDHIHANGYSSSLDYRIDPDTLPWNHDQDLRIRSEGVPISPDQLEQAHGDFIAFIEEGNFPSGSIRSRLSITSNSTPAAPALPIATPETTPDIHETRSTDFVPMPYTNGETPELSDIGEPDIETYRQLILDGVLPDPGLYRYFPNGDTVSLEQAKAITAEGFEGGLDLEFIQRNLFCHTPEQVIEIFRLVGVPEYDIPNFVGMARGESAAYCTQIIGDRNMGVDEGAIGWGQHLAQYMTEGTGMTHEDMFDPWLNSLESVNKYHNNWRIYGFEGRFRDWNAVNNNTEAFQAGLAEALVLLNRENITV